MAETESEFVPPVIPKDSEGFVQSFTSDQTEEITSFFFKYGFVVIRDVITEAEVESTVNDLWKFYLPKIPRNDRTKWIDANWYEVFGSGYNMKRGFLGYYPSVSNSAWNNRQSPNLVKAFSTIYGRQDLWVKIDRFGFMRPTRGLIKEENKTMDMPEWETERQWIHWDLNPWEEEEFCRVQGVLALTDHTETSGGFHCVPGFPPYLPIWAQKNKKLQKTGCLIDVPRSDPIQAHIQKITMRKGSITIWDSRTPHGNFPNESSGFRICQYVTFFPAPTDPKLIEERRSNISSYFENPPPKFTELGKKITGLMSYSKEETDPPSARKYNEKSIFNMNQWDLK